MNVKERRFDLLADYVTNLMIIHLRRIQTCMKCHSNVSIETDGWIKNSIQITKCDRTLWHLVHKKGKGMTIQIQSNSHRAAAWNSTFDPTFMNRVVLEPRPLSVNVHRVSFIVFTWYFWKKQSVLVTRNMIAHEKSLTEHFIATDIDTSYAKSWICIRCVFINREFPIMNSSWEANRAESDAMFPTVRWNRSVVIHES